MKLRGHSFGWNGLAAIIVLLLHGTAHAAPASTSAAAPSLHDRIARIDAGEQTFADPKQELAAIEAMQAEAAGGAQIDPQDRLVLGKLHAVATAHTGDFPGGTRIMASVVAQARKLGLDHDPLMGVLLENLGTMESLHGDPASGLSDLQAAAAVIREQREPDLDELGAIQGNIGYTYTKLGRAVDAVDALRKAVDGRSPAPNTRVAYLANVDTLVSSLERLGEYDEALRYARLGLDRAADWLPKGHVGFAYFHFNTAAAYLETGRLDEAEASYRQGLAVLETHPGAFRGIAGIAVGRLADIAAARGQLAEAEAFARRSLELVKDTRVSEQAALGTGWVRLGRILLTRGDDAGAMAAAESAVAGYKDRGDTSGSVWMAHQLMARTLLAQGNPAGALAAIDLALGLLEKQLPPEAPERSDAETLRALILARLGRPEEAWRTAEPVLARMGAAFADPRASRRARSALAPQQRRSFARLADVAAATGHQADAFRAAQLASFTEISASSLALAARAASRDPVTAAEARAVQDLQERLDHLARERSFAQGKSGEQVAAIDGRIKAAEAELNQRLAALRRASPAYDGLTSPAPLDPEAARASLARGSALLLPVQSDDRLTTLVLTRAGLTAHAAPLAERDAQRAVQRLRGHVEGALGSADFDADAAWQLGGALFAKPVLIALRGVRQVDLVGSGPLMTLPPGMLLTAKPAAGAGLAALPYALRRFAFAVRPTARSAAQVSETRSLAFLGVGAPVLGPANDVLRGSLARSAGILRGGVADAASLRALPSLPRAGEELQAIAAALGGGGTRAVLLTGSAASEAGVRAQPLARFGLLAFATHGLISGELSGLDEPALVLTPPGSESRASDDDGLLTASEIAGLDLHAQWVILSACNTGAGAENGAGGYSGLARGFMQAGARSLLVSLWPVRDDVAARLTVETVRGQVRGLGPAEALRRAALRLIADRTVPGAADPATWAPFSLVTQ